MNLCADGHDEICHESRQCPLCDEMALRKDDKDEFNTLRVSLEGEINSLTEQLEKQRNEVLEHMRAAIELNAGQVETST